MYSTVLYKWTDVQEKTKKREWSKRWGVCVTRIKITCLIKICALATLESIERLCSRRPTAAPAQVLLQLVQLSDKLLFLFHQEKGDTVAVFSWLEGHQAARLAVADSFLVLFIDGLARATRTAFSWDDRVAATVKRHIRKLFVVNDNVLISAKLGG